MRDDRVKPVLDSGMIVLSRSVIDELPDGPAVFRLRNSGQSVVYVGHADEGGLARAVREIWAGHAMTGVATVEYDIVESDDVAAAAAAEEIDALRPLYNEGYGRFRNADVHIPKQGHRIRKAMDNP